MKLNVRLFTVLLVFTVVFMTASSHAAQRVVLAEEFTNITCENCPGAMTGLHQLKDLMGDLVAVIAYHHVNIGGDPFYFPEAWQRALYYDVTGYPVVWFDGVIERRDGNPDPGSPVDYTDSYQQRAAIPSPVTIDLFLVTYDGGTGQGTVRAQIYNETDDPVQGYLRFVAVGEDTLYNWVNFDHLYHTALQVFPDAMGVMVTINPGETVTEFQDFLIPDGWRDRQVTVVAFLQSDSEDRGEVYQAANLSQVTPVELVSFTGSVGKDGVVLSWTTATELENAGFRITRIHEGNRELITETLIPGAGTSAIPHSYRFTDTDVEPGATYGYQLSDVSLDGIERNHTPVWVSIPATWGVPTVFRITALNPNPASEAVSVAYAMPEAGELRYEVFDISGHLIASDTLGEVSAGSGVVTWDLTHSAGRSVADGLYMIRLTCGENSVSSRLIVTR